MHLLRIFASATILATVGSFAIACSSPDGGSSSSAEGACAQYASALTSFMSRCGGSNVGVNEARMKLACASALSVNGTSITPQNVSACANAVKDLSCTGDFDEIAACDFPPGKLADGTACVSSDQCASEWCKQGDATCGVCTARVAIGGTCTSDSRCVAGATCSAGKCVAEVKNPAGGSCDSAKGESCQSGLYCDFSTDTCKAYVAAGGACSTSARCQQDLTCDPTSKTCVKPTLAAEGQTCSFTVRCQSGLVCDPSAMKCAKLTMVPPGGTCGGALQRCEEGSCNEATNKCPTVIPDGGACVAGDPSQTCAAYADCVDGKCLLAGQVVCK